MDKNPDIIQLLVEWTRLGYTTVEMVDALSDNGIMLKYSDVLELRNSPEYKLQGVCFHEMP